MQKSEAEHVAGERAFTALEKGRALIVLMNYSERTGKKWAAICSEIMDLVGGSATLSAPLLTRQDLEAWTSGRSILGDRKFSLVFDFLSHPTTRSRPEFTGIDSLFVSERISSYSKMLRSLIGDEQVAAIFSEQDEFSEFRELFPQELDGIHSIEFGGGAMLLYLSYDESTKAYLAHLFVSQRNDATLLYKNFNSQILRRSIEAESDVGDTASFRKQVFHDVDWEVQRYSGIGVFGENCLLFLRGIEKKDAKIMSLHMSAHSFRGGKAKSTKVWSIDGDLLHEIAQQAAGSTKFAKGYADDFQVGVSDFTFRVRRGNGPMAQDFFHELRWNVGL